MYTHVVYVLYTYYNSSDTLHITKPTYIYLLSLFLPIFVITMTSNHHNYDLFLGGATYDDSPSKRYIYKFYHKEIKVINNKCYAVFSITGDVFLKGQVARMMGIIIGMYMAHD